MPRVFSMLRLLSSLTLALALAGACGPGAAPPDAGGSPPGDDPLPTQRDDAGTLSDAGTLPDAGTDAGAHPDAGPGEDGGPTDGGQTDPPARCRPDVEGERFGICDGRLSFEAATEGGRFGVVGHIEPSAPQASGARFGISGGELHVP